MQVQLVARLAGLLLSVAQAVFLVRWCTRTLYRLIGVVVYDGCVMESRWWRKQVRWAWNRWCTLPEEVVSEIRWWRENLLQWNERPIWQQEIQKCITMDASKYGWGGWCGQWRKWAEWTEEERTWSSNRRELTTVECMLLRVQEHVEAGVWECLEGVEVAIGIRSDNTVTVTALNSCYSKSPVLLAVVSRIWVLAARVFTKSILAARQA